MNPKLQISNRAGQVVNFKIVIISKYKYIIKMKIQLRQNLLAYRFQLRLFYR